MSPDALEQRVAALPAPYTGLRPFEKREAPIFFGRGEQVADMLARLGESRFLAVVGGSGSGKSSLVKAGLLPALAEGFLLEAGTEWLMVQARPGGRPFWNLAEAFQKARAELAGSGAQPMADAVGSTKAVLRSGPLGIVQATDDAQMLPDVNILILVDQFEELFRFRNYESADQSQDGAARAAEDRNTATAFVTLLLATVWQTQRPIYVVITMRSDFMGDCDAFLGLPEAISDNQFLTPRLNRQQLEEVITGPLRLFGASASPEVVNTLLNDVGRDRDELPLLQHVLLRMWHLAQARCQSGRAPVDLTMADYVATGGVHEALSKHADEIVGEVTDEMLLGKPVAEINGRVAELLFRCLCDRSAEQRLTRRLATVAEIAAVAGVSADVVIRVADAFRQVGRSFLMPPTSVPLTPDSTLDISHESLIRQWVRLQKWIEREERSAAIYRRLSETARLAKIGQAGLYRPPDLDIALKWKESERPTAAWTSRYDANFDESMTFLEASQKARQIRTGVMVIAFVAVSALALFAGWKWLEAESAKRKAKDAAKAADASRWVAESSRREADTVFQAASTMFKNAAEQYIRPTKVGGDIVAAISQKDTALLRDKFEQLRSSDRPFVPNRDVGEKLKVLEDAVSGWDPSSLDSSNELRTAVLRLSNAYRSAWESDRQILNEETRILALVVFAKPSYMRAMSVTRKLADGDRSQENVDEFERLYWSELAFVETERVEVAMVKFRRALVEKRISDLPELADKLEEACNAALPQEN